MGSRQPVDQSTWYSTHNAPVYYIYLCRPVNLHYFHPSRLRTLICRSLELGICPACNMQYVGQTGRILQKRFGENYRRMKKPKLIDTFLYQHFKRTSHSPNDVLVQPMEKLTFDKNSSSRFKIIKRHGTELKWIQLLQTPFPLGFNNHIYHEGNTSKIPYFDVFSLLEIRKRNSRSHGLRKKEKHRISTYPGYSD